MADTPAIPSIESIHALLQQGQVEAAEEQVRSRLEALPTDADAVNLLGGVLLGQGRLAAAEAEFRRVLALQPRHTIALHNLGTVLLLGKRFGEAAPVFRAALAADPSAVATWLQLLTAESGLREPAAQIALLYEALSHCPENATLLHRLMLTLARQGRSQEALTHGWHAVRVASTTAEGAEIRSDMAQLLLQQLRLKPAETLLREAEQMVPAHPRVTLNLGSLLYHARRFREAAVYCRRAMELNPRDSRPWTNLAMVHMALGESREALETFRMALERKPDHLVARSNLLLAMQYSDAVSAAEIIQEAKRYGGCLSGRAMPPAAMQARGSRRLRIGYVSGDFRRHVVGTFLLPVFSNHEQSRVEIHAYSMVEVPDPITQALARHAKAWTDIRGLDDAALARRIREDGIDVLVDLGGHSADNRLGTFAYRPAPVQVSWLGFPGVIGVPGISHRITDAVLDPPGEDPPGMEVPLRLPHGWFCYTPSPAWGGQLPVGPLPARANGFVTFGAFNNLAKVSPSCLDLWARVLRAVPQSRLVARAKPFDDPAEQQRFREALARHGVDSARITALPYLPDPEAHMRVYNEVDIHLDSLPYSGGTTSCDALWMGVPVLSLAGDRPSARLGASVLVQLGLPELVATTHEEYLGIAVGLAADIERLEDLRTGLRQRFVASPLHDALRFTRDLEQAFFDLCTDSELQHLAS